MVITAGSSNARRIFREVWRILQTETIRKDYGDLIDTANMSTLEMFYKYEIEYNSPDPCLKCATQQGEIIGFHPALLHLEDPIQEERVSYESNERIKRWYDEVVRYLAVYSKDNPTRINITATRKGVNDFYSWLMEKRGFRSLHKRAIEEENGKITTLNCPNWSEAHLLEAREQDPIGFNSQMQNNPSVPTGVYFKREEWSEFEIVRNAIDYYIAVDPGVGLTEVADFTAIIVVTILDGKMYVVDGIVDRIDYDSRMDKIKHFNDIYRPHSLLIEKVLTQQLEYQALERLGNVEAFTHTQTNAKYMRIDAMKSYFKRGLILVNKNIQPYEELFLEYLNYNQRPSTASRKDDALDALSMLIMKFGRYLEADGRRKVTDSNWYI